MKATPNSVVPDAVIYGLLAIPFIAYGLIVFHYVVDIPFLDDYVNPLDLTNQAIAAPTLSKKLSLLAVPMNGHLPFFPRLLLYAQFLMGVEAPVRTALYVSNLGWVLTTLLLLVYSRRVYAIPLHYLVPVPYLMLSIIHWEAMDFYSAAFQMYWGSGLFSIAGIIALVSGLPLLAAVLFLAGLFTSSGTLAVYPACILYVAIAKQWRVGLRFALYSIPVLCLYFYVVSSTQQLQPFPGLMRLIRYVFEFMGNVSSTGKWDLTQHATLHVLIGIFVISSAVVLSLRVAGHYAAKTIFAYVIFMAAMAAYSRIHTFEHAVSRYAMYSLLAAAAVYILFCAYCVSTADRHQKAKQTALLLVTLGSAGLWVHGVVLCRIPLQTNHDQKLAGMQKYIDGGNPADLFSWNAEHAAKVLAESQKTGLYDYRNATRR